MTYYLVQNLGWHIILYVIAYGISYFLIKQQLFRAHVGYLVLLAVLTVISAIWGDLVEFFGGRSLVFLLVVCAWDHYWARCRLGQQPLKLEKARKLQMVLAAALSVCWLLCLLGIGVFQYFEEELVFVAAVLLWGYGYFHRNDTGGKTPPHTS